MYSCARVCVVVVVANGEEGLLLRMRWGRLNVVLGFVWEEGTRWDPGRPSEPRRSLLGKGSPPPPPLPPPTRSLLPRPGLDWRSPSVTGFLASSSSCRYNSSSSSSSCYRGPGRRRRCFLDRLHKLRRRWAICDEDHLGLYRPMHVRRTHVWISIGRNCLLYAAKLWYDSNKRRFVSC